MPCEEGFYAPGKILPEKISGLILDWGNSQQRVMNHNILAEICLFVIPYNPLHYHLPVFIGGGGKQNHVLADAVAGIDIAVPERTGGG